MHRLGRILAGGRPHMGNLLSAGLVAGGGTMKAAARRLVRSSDGVMRRLGGPAGCYLDHRAGTRDCPGRLAARRAPRPKGRVYTLREKARKRASKNRISSPVHGAYRGACRPVL